MRTLLIVILVLLCNCATGCSLGRQNYLRQAAKQDIPLPDDGTNQRLDIHPHFQQSNVTLKFTTTKSPEQVLQWYRDTLLAHGWQLASESASDQLSAPPPNVSDRYLAQRHAATRERLWISCDDYDTSGTTTVRIQLESIGPLEAVERTLIAVIDVPGAFLDDSFPGVCWYFFWAPLKLPL